MLLRRSNVRETNSSFRRYKPQRYRENLPPSLLPHLVQVYESKSTFSDLLLFPDISLSRSYTLSLSFSDIQFPFIRKFSRRADKRRFRYLETRCPWRLFFFLLFFLFFYLHEKLPFFSPPLRTSSLLSSKMSCHFSRMRERKKKKRKRIRRESLSQRLFEATKKNASRCGEGRLCLNTAKLERREIFSGAFQPPREKSSLSTNLARGCTGYWAGSMPTARWISRQTRPTPREMHIRSSRVSNEPKVANETERKLRTSSGAR